MTASDPPPLITQCPNCHTRFRVGESQLQMAHGRVRCGACLAVFAGVDHLLLDESATPPELPSDPDELDSVLAELKVDPDGGTDSQEADEPPPDQSEEHNDWTSVSVDTRVFGRNPTLETTHDDVAGLAAADSDSAAALPGPEAHEPRASISEALSDEEALRWWLEDELPGAVDSGVFDGEPGSLGGDGEMSVQLSQLDAVGEEQLDLRALIGPGENNSDARALEEMFEKDLEEELNHGDPALAQDAQDLDDELDDSEHEELEHEELEDDVTDQAVAENDTQEAFAPDVSSDELQEAIDEAEPLVTRAMANGTIAAAAARMSTAPNAKQSSATGSLAESLGEKGRGGPVALVESPHKSAAPVVPIKQESPDSSGSSAEGRDAGRQDSGWDLDAFDETPAELVEDISEQMAAAGQPDVEPEPSILERGRLLINGFLGNVVALRVATALAFVLLAGQILYWQFADWSKTDTMRPVYAQLCNVLGCELPVRRSVRDLQSRKLAVRSHPDKEGSLLVDALIVNEAHFEQPFPVIELQFMDINQQVVRSYRLEPGEYLDGELLGSDALMAVRTPVHIDIDILDPGPKAVNYQLQFR